MALQGILHVNLTIAPGEAAFAEARHFYIDLLGLEELPRPDETDSNAPGYWLGCGNGQQIHLSAESEAQNLNSASRRHAAFQVGNLAELHAQLEAAQVPLQHPKHTPDGIKRFFARDPWGNRLEFVEVL